MTKPVSFGKLEVSLTADMEAESETPSPDVPFHILLLGDFSGHSTRKDVQPAGSPQDWSPIKVDDENLDSVMSRLPVQVHVPGLGGGKNGLPLTFTSLEDFHPNRLLQQGEALPALMNLYQRLKDPSTFPEAAAEIRAWKGHNSSTSSSPCSEDVEKPQTGEEKASYTGNVLEDILESSSPQRGDSPVLGDERTWHRWIEEIVAPYVVPRTDPDQPELVGQVETAVRELLRTILHDAGFQSLEAAWRGLAFLTQRLELSPRLKVFMLDISKESLALDLAKDAEGGASCLEHLLVDQGAGTPGGIPWALVAGHYCFYPTPEDMDLLDRLASVVRQAGISFLAEAGSELIGCSSLATTPDPDDWPGGLENPALASWRTLRQQAKASNIGLVLPRFLLRLPYGTETEPLETIRFEEMENSPRHEDFLWGNPIFVCLQLIGQNFIDHGWERGPGEYREVEGLPLYVYTQQGEARLQPCAEILLTERATEIILDKGVMALLSLKDQDVIRLARFQSIAQPPTSLIGRWR